MEMKFNFGAFFMIWATVATAQTDSLYKFLFYTNKNQKVDEIYFYDLHKKVVRGRQEESGPLPIYLMNEANIICDTLSRKVLPEFILYGRQGNVYITGSTKFEHIQILDSVFLEREQFSTLECDVKDVQGMWRILKFNNEIIGLQGTGKKMVFQKVNLQSGIKSVLIPAWESIKIQDQKVVDVNYFLSKEHLLIFIVPCQKLFKVSLADFSVSEVVFPERAKDDVWYYFYDHVEDNHYAVHHVDKKYFLHLLKGENQFVKLTSLIAFPKAIVNGHIHFAERTSEGTMHYMVPVATSVREERESADFMLKEVVIKQ